MGVLFRDQKDKKKYYEEEAEDLRRQSGRVSRETGDKVEAGRLAGLAKDSENAAKSIDKQLDQVAKDQTR